jgi:hypothetical protein
MLCLADLQKKIDEAAEEMRHITQDDQDRRPQYRDLHQDIRTTTMNGMMISIMATLLLMMLLL